EVVRRATGERDRVGPCCLNREPEQCQRRQGPREAASPHHDGSPPTNKVVRPASGPPCRQHAWRSDRVRSGGPVASHRRVAPITTNWLRQPAIATPFPVGRSHGGNGPLERTMARCP